MSYIPVVFKELFCANGNALADLESTVMFNNSIDDESACLVVKDSNGNPFSYYFTQHYKYVYVVDYRLYFNRTLKNFVDCYGIDDVIFCTSMFLVQSEGCNNLLNSFIR